MIKHILDACRPELVKKILLDKSQSCLLLIIERRAANRKRSLSRNVLDEVVLCSLTKRVLCRSRAWNNHVMGELLLEALKILLCARNINLVCGNKHGLCRNAECA